MKDQQNTTPSDPKKVEAEKKEEPKVDPKTDETKKEEPKKDDKPALTGAPEKYEPFKAPEGQELSAELVESATGLFKELNVSQEGAQKLVDFYNDQITKAAQAPYDTFVETRKGWRQEIATDKVLGDGKGDLKPEVKASFSAMIGSLPTEVQTAFKEAMVVTGAGDHPAFNRAFYHFAQAFAEGKPVKAGGPTGNSGEAQKTGAQSLYPNLPSEHSPRAG